MTVNGADDGRAPRPRVTAAFFDDLYEREEDPWGFASRAYEREKYDHTLSLIGSRRFERALEIGCSIGVFTERLAPLCDELVAIDVSERALERARRRLRDQAHVTFTAMTFPEEMAPGPWDLVACCEVLYYLDPPAFALALDRLRDAVASGATLLAVHWRAPTETYPLRGDEVHDALVAELGRWHVLDDRREPYRLDGFEGP
ncbi:MAG: hypothetical protein QOJ89_3368 [bacterium]